MRKMIILAISAILAMNINAQEEKPEFKPECKGPKFTKEQRIDFDIKRFTNELMLSDKQAEKFAVTYREYAEKLDELLNKNVFDAKPEPGKDLTEAEMDELAKKRFKGMKDLAELQEKYYAKFRKDLSARQVEKVLRLNEPFGHKPCCGKFEGNGCGKQEGKGGKFEGKKGFGPKPEGSKQRGEIKN